MRQRCRVSYVTGASKFILAYSWVWPAILATGEGRGEMIFISSVSSLSFNLLSPLSPTCISSTISSISLFPFFVSPNKNTHKD